MPQRHHRRVGRFGRFGRLMAALVLAGAVGSSVSTQAFGQSVLQPGFVETRIAVSPAIRAPHAIKFGPDGRLYLLEQIRGAVRIVQNDVLLTTPLITLPVISGGSRGLLGIAFHPQFQTNGFFYLTYTTNSGGFVHNRLSRFTAVGNTASLASEVVLFDGEDLLDKQMHFGGDVNVGPDGKLYVSTGDRLVSANSQSLTTTFGKMLRFNLDGTIPTDNPFYATTTGNNRAIWARGLRNAFKFVFQRTTGRMIIADVGSDDWEELDQGAAGANYGWPNFEGNGGTAGFTDPVFTYNHNTGDPTGCAAMGGDFYNPNVVQFPAGFVGTYIFPDHCQGWMKSIDIDHGNQIRDILTGLEQPVDVKIDPATGALYYIARTVNGVAGGGLFRIDYRGGNVPLAITRQPQNATAAIGGDATFDVQASGQPPISFQWQRDGQDIPGATAPTLVVSNAASTDDGAQFRVRVTDASGSLNSDAATLIIDPNQRPTAVIDLPLEDTTWVAGTEMTYGGHGTDPEDGDLPAAAMTWEVVMHHHEVGTPNEHTHPFVEAFSGATGGSFVIPTDNEVEPDIWYRIHLTVADVDGATHSTYRDVFPRTTQITLATQPAGLQLKLDGQPITAPLVGTSVEGMQRLIEAPTTQVLNGTTYSFVGWNDGGAPQHTISTPTGDTSYIATYTAVASTKTALYVAGTPTNLGADRTVVDRLTAMGFAVTVADDNGITAAAAAGKTMVFISATVDGGAVGNVFRNVAVPVMVWKPALYDNFLMTGAVWGTNQGMVAGQRTVLIQPIAHPLAPNGAQTITIISAAKPLPWGVPRNTADIIGRSGTRASLFSYSPGDLRTDGSTTPACRIAFPLSPQVIPLLTAAGWDLFTRSVNWATTGGCQGTP